MPSQYPLVAAALVLTAATTAAADPIAVLVGGSLRGHRGELHGYDRLDDGGGGPGPALAATVAYRLPRGLAAGVRAGISWQRYGSHFSGNMASDDHDYRMVPIDLGVTLQYARGGLWIAPWVGRHITRRSGTDTFCTYPHGMPGPPCTTSAQRVDWTDDWTSFGAAAGFDVWHRGSHRAAVFLDAQTGSGGYSAIGVGVGYRR